MQRCFFMKITIDANILFSCLIKDSQTRKLFFNPELSIFAPQFISEELIKYLPELRAKAKLSETEFLVLLDKIFRQIKIMPDKDLTPFLPAAASLIKDPKDWLYLACALSEDTIIWTNDKDFKTQSRVKALTTNELSQLIGTL